MLACAISAAVLGVDAFEVRVEVDVARGLPNLTVVGLPDAAVQESRQRVRAAVRNAGFPFPTGRITINLAPADIRKEGPAFDLPIALALLAAQDLLPRSALEEVVLCGELALDGQLRPVKGAINIGLFAAEAGFERVLVPPGNAAEVAAIESLAVLTPRHLGEAVAVLRGEQTLEPARPGATGIEAPQLDLADVKGQAAAKRALEIAAAGGHNLLMTGAPGTGKTMLARRLPGLLPALLPAEAIEVTRIHSSAGILNRIGLVTRAPFRSPHHTVSYAGLVGGGSVPRPGEVSLAHRGVLFMDEFPEFGRRALELLRQPLEDGVVTISRTRASLTFPARFLLVASRNPCPCGFYGDGNRECSCSPEVRRRYRDRISGPLLDRIDLHLWVPRLPADELLRPAPGEASMVVAKRVAAARHRAHQRQGDLNATLSGRDLRRHCRLDPPAEAFAQTVAQRMTLSGRGYDRLLRVARTVADLAGSNRIEEGHLAEAVGYREG